MITLINFSLVLSFRPQFLIFKRISPPKKFSSNNLIVKREWILKCLRLRY